MAVKSETVANAMGMMFGRDRAQENTEPQQTAEQNAYTPEYGIAPPGREKQDEVEYIQACFKISKELNKRLNFMKYDSGITKSQFVEDTLRRELGLRPIH